MNKKNTQLTPSQQEAIELIRSELEQAENPVYRAEATCYILDNLAGVYNTLVLANMDAENNLLDDLENEFGELCHELRVHEDGATEELVDYYYDWLEKLATPFLQEFCEKNK